MWVIRGRRGGEGEGRGVLMRSIVLSMYASGVCLSVMPASSAETRHDSLKLIALTLSVARFVRHPSTTYIHRTRHDENKWRLTYHAPRIITHQALHKCAGVSVCLSRRTAPVRTAPHLIEGLVLHDHGLAQLLRLGAKLSRPLLQGRLVVVRRHPLHKNTGVPTAAQLRAGDGYSPPLRIVFLSFPARIRIVRR